ncbi:MAG: cyclic nucleotide-binding domain-containing protein [Bacteroidota bacterium]
MDQKQIVTALQQSSLFSALDQEALSRIAQRVKVRQFFPHDVIVWQGQPSTALFLIHNGIVAVRRVVREKESTLAYLMPGNTFGEVGILENQARSASVVALSEVDVLVIRREDFVEMMHQYPAVSIELAKTLGRYLMQSNRRLSQEGADSKLILIFNTEENGGGTSIGNLMAEHIAQELGQTVGYLEYPNPFRALNGFQLPKGRNIYHHASGYDIVLPQSDGYLPASTRVTLLYDKLRDTYESVIFKVQGGPDGATEPLLEHATQIMIIAAPTQEAREEVQRWQQTLKGKIRPEETGVLVLMNRHKPEHKDMPIYPEADFDLPYLEDFPMFELPHRRQTEIPEHLDRVLSQMTLRLERTNSLGIFIPTTKDVDETADTSTYRDEALKFMAERFGGATCKVASGVWNSEKLGLVGEVIYIVHSYITQADLNQHLDEVVAYIKELKKELQQEAMALEVNNKLTLI